MAVINSHISRRAMLFAGGGAAAAATGGAMLKKGAGGPDMPDTTVGIFHVTEASELLPPRPLHNVTGPQSISFDDVHGHVYALQVMSGGLQLPDETQPLSGRARRLAGDMCVTAISRTGTVAGHMYLRGFGHGISMGVEPAAGSVLLWVESDADTRTGYGRAVARVPFRHDTVLDSSSPSVGHHRPIAGNHTIHPAVDVAGKRLLVSHWAGSVHHYSVYLLDEFLDGRYEPLFRTKDVALRGGETLQGCALHGNHIYQLTGTPYTDEAGDNPRSSGGNTYVSAIDIRSGRTAGRRKVIVAPELSFREPEGLAVRMASEPELCLAFSVKAPGRRKLTVYACPS